MEQQKEPSEFKEFEVKSQVSSSKSSGRSSRSSVSAAATKAKAKAEAALVEAKYAAQEAEMMKEKARIEAENQQRLAEAELRKAELEANLYVLKVKRSATAASAEAAVYEAAAAIESDPLDNTIQIDPENRAQRTSEYVQAHYVTLNAQQQAPVSQEPPAIPTSTERACPDSIQWYPLYNQETCLPKPSTEDEVTPDTQNKGYSPYVPVPVSHTSSLRDYPCEAVQVTDLTKYLVRKEMVSSGLLKFDDRPENYWAWKTSFQAVIGELNLTAREELDLLIKWLGPDSSPQAMRLRSVNVHDPMSGVSMVWQRLDDTYGSPEIIENALLLKLETFPKISNKDNQRLRELGDVLMEIQSAKSGGHLPGLAYLDTARGVNPIVEKLPCGLQERWITQGSKYKEDHKVSFPPFSYFVSFICSQAKTRNDPSFLFSTCSAMNQAKSDKPLRYNNSSKTVSVRKTEVAVAPAGANCVSEKKLDEPADRCPIHSKPHPLAKCRGFRLKHIDERKAYLKENSICFRCCASTKHLAKDCKVAVKCKECNSDKHLTALHPGPAPWFTEASVTRQENGGEQENSSSPEVTSKCTEICDKTHGLRSCSKISLVSVYPENHPNKAQKMYVVLDDQSNRSLAKSAFFDLFGINAASSTYTLRTCAGIKEVTGRKAHHFVVSSLDGKTQVVLPPLLECNTMPDDRTEIPTPDIVQHFPHLAPVAGKIPPIEPATPILLLLGRDVLSVHKVREQYNGPHNTPYAQRLDLGWVIVGEVCLGGAHKQTKVNVYKTNVLNNGRTSFLEPCPHAINVKERLSAPSQQAIDHKSHVIQKAPLKSTDNLGLNIFQRNPNDDKTALSIEDKIFLEIMDREVYMDDDNHWVAPLPFRTPRPLLPNNRDQAMKRLNVLLRTLEKKKDMREQFTEFMQKIFDNDQAEVAPSLQPGEECWYLPTFGVYHPQKPGKIRVVFDSSASFKGISLNDILLRGPDLNNTLLGVLLRFRQEQVAVTVDVEQMFYCFRVKESHRNYLRFLWFEDNNLSKGIKEFRMKVPVFGNSPSPAISIYGLRRAAELGQGEYSANTKQFVFRNFYVDDGLTSVASESEAIELLAQTRNMMAESNIRLHKIASNASRVMGAFPPEERAADLKDLDLNVDPLPLQRSLGMSWNLESDCFTFRVAKENKPFTRRGILSVVNSLYDPLGFAAPVTIQGKALYRELTMEQQDWDEPLPEDREAEWVKWTDSLTALEHIQIQRPFVPVSLSHTQRRELCIFSDASSVAIAAVAYLKVIDTDDQCYTGFIMGKSKLAPTSAHTIPRLELCAAVLAVELAQVIMDECDIEFHAVNFYTDSRIVLGYIHNVTRRFYVYVANRVAQIHRSTKPDQWHYVSTDQNPADHGTRTVLAAQLLQTTWLSGPQFLLQPNTEQRDTVQDKENFDLVHPSADVEIRPQVTSLATKAEEKELGSHRFMRFSTWKSLVRAIKSLIHIAKSFSKASSTCKGWHSCNLTDSTEITQAKTVIIQCIQTETYKEEIESLKKGKEIPLRSPLGKLDPFIDGGLLRVGGRLQSADLSNMEKHPLIIPGNHHAAILLVRHYHNQVAHQGRQFTEGALRSAGLWIVGAKRLISSTLHKCVICRKLRGRLEVQKMASLPIDRLAVDPPFTHVGLDVFGPWNVMSRRTRGNATDCKRWAVMFTCLSTRAVHIEVTEAMSTSSFINALRRFLSIRGPVKHLRSDQGTNFIGACKELQINTKDPDLKCYLQDQGCTWTFNAPHSSHMGGVWERMIGLVRRILDGLLLKTSTTRLTHEVLVTLMAEVMAIMNARPLVPISTDPETPEVLSPAMLLTQKACAITAPPGDFELKDLYKAQWRQVQGLADCFWKKWRQEYLATLQTRQKWKREKPNVKLGDIILLKDTQVKRNEWPIGIVVKAIPSDDNRVRKVEVNVMKQGAVKTYLRPVTDIIVLLSEVGKCV